MSTGGQGTKFRKNIAENYNRLSGVHERYGRQTGRQTTDGRATAYSSRSLKICTEMDDEVLKYSRMRLKLLENYGKLRISRKDIFFANCATAIKSLPLHYVMFIETSEMEQNTIHDANRKLLCHTCRRH